MANEKTAKAPNYTPEQSEMVVSRYTANPTAETVKALAEELGKATRSIIAKLSREGVYKKKEYTNKQGEKPVKKNELADKLGAIVGLSEAEIDSLEKANKTAMVKVLDFMQKLTDLADKAASRADKAEAELDEMLGAPRDEISREG